MARRGSSEHDIQKAICEYLDVMKIEYSVTDASRTFGPDGQPRRSKVSKDWPDISAVIRRKILSTLIIGQAFFIEVKSATGKASKGQMEQLTRLQKAGALVVIARSVDDVEAVVKAHHVRA